MKRYNSRKTVDGRRIRNAHYVWNLHNPDDPIRPGDGYVVHHKDGNKKNDAPDNLEKKTDQAHRSEHADGCGLRKWREENPELARRHSQKGAKKMHDFLRKNPEKLAETKKNRRAGLIKFNRARGGENRRAKLYTDL